MERQHVRLIWLFAETIHAVVYFAPEKADLYRDAGLKGGWMGYFASRAAAMGAVGPAAVAACFYNFHPDMVARAIPDAWRFSDPQRVLQARNAAASQALQRLVPDSLIPSIERFTTAARDALMELSYAGRPLAAAHAGLPWPQDPRLALWHGCTVWREYRGDAHVAALVCEALGPVEAHLTLAATGAVDEETLRSNRGWAIDEWELGRARLRDKGLLDPDDTLTQEGRQVRRRVEDATDTSSAAPWESFGDRVWSDVVRPLADVAEAVVSSGTIPFPNPMGLGEAELREGFNKCRERT